MVYSALFSDTGFM